MFERINFLVTECNFHLPGNMPRWRTCLESDAPRRTVGEQPGD
ncbi:hypothetical protein BX589_10179 [Paraburkholderia fungorum]|nr:hypothetical protein BX589_10179 [Paraburkholderia fungorum]